jgi:hypothetical protein
MKRASATIEANADQIVSTALKRSLTPTDAVLIAVLRCLVGAA